MVGVAAEAGLTLERLKASGKVGCSWARMRTIN
jgi:hypothetical protein